MQALSLAAWRLRHLEDLQIQLERDERCLRILLKNTTIELTKTTLRISDSLGNLLYEQEGRLTPCYTHSVATNHPFVVNRLTVVRFENSCFPCTLGVDSIKLPSCEISSFLCVFGYIGIGTFPFAVGLNCTWQSIKERMFLLHEACLDQVIG